MLVLLKKTSTKYLLYYIICSFTLGEFLIHHVLPFFTVHMTIACRSFYNLYPKITGEQDFIVRYNPASISCLSLCYIDVWIRLDS